LCNDFQAKLLLTPLEFCSDNAAMIGRAAIDKYNRKEFADIFALQSSPKNTEGEFI
ncbi:tRNA (adenosine(37)-N6)-threonylcarbamoyltransferase complex transferase subunit TsaD, partial [Helicobacter sp. faydin-H76]|nr:tRNA (adenosine(37)-N6)-threonylcarbamoyltransferase complex transferase subunit TsaD [Helicobacter sp. faydin-H75]MDP2539824.1 tRNA (adenosine(37)-N6)-threonylcarbamoyltransferase complex transferase subunit TsaD [Helicobacter sp. faydin-H76]